MSVTGPTSFSTEILDRLRSLLPANPPVYLVGGAVRDMLLGRTTHDLDFAMEGDAIRLGRRVADALGGAFYPLDTERGAGRVILTQADGSRQVLDFSRLRGPDLENDLRGRDFTINAIALDLHHPQQLIDPLNGANDLHAQQLCACSPTSLSDDPLRGLRAVRLALEFNLRILPETTEQIRQALPNLERISPERLRDELFRILDGPQPDTAMRTLGILGALPYLLPELDRLKGVKQSSPHVVDVWNHTLHVVHKIVEVLNALQLEHDPKKADNWALGLIALRLGRYRQQLHEHLSLPPNPDRSLRSLLLLAALYHDTGKAETGQYDPNGRIRFLEHEQVGAKITAQRAEHLRLSSVETERLEKIVRNHMRPLLLAQADQIPSRRAIYRFFRDCGEAGVDICLLSLADTLGTYGTTLPQPTWIGMLDTVRALLEAYWEYPQEKVSPPALLNGNDLMRAFNLPSGPQIGLLLENIREAQAAGEIENRQQALDLARTILAA